MYIYLYIYIYIYVHIYTYIYIYGPEQASIVHWNDTSSCLLYVYVNIYTYPYIYIYIHTYPCKYIYICICICIYIYSDLNRHPSSTEIIRPIVGAGQEGFQLCLLLALELVCRCGPIVQPERDNAVVAHRHTRRDVNARDEASMCGVCVDEFVTYLHVKFVTHFTMKSWWLIYMCSAWRMSMQEMRLVHVGRVCGYKSYSLGAHTALSAQWETRNDPHRMNS